MKKLKLKFFASIAIVVLVLSCIVVNFQQPIKAKAETVNDLHTVTRISSKTETEPTITILTHGLDISIY